MLLVILIWTALVALAYAFGGAVLDLLTSGAAWLQANADVAAWIEPLLAFAATLGTGAAAVVWIVGVVLIVLLSRLFRGRGYDAHRGEHWRHRARHWSRRREHDDDYDDDRHYRRRSRRRRDDDDDDD